MAKLYVVNCTAQLRQVFYRLDFSVDEKGNRIDGRALPPKYIEIPAGAQVQFGGDLFPGQIEQLVQQLEFSCGAVNVNEVRTAKAQGVVKLIWSLDKPVPRPVCEDVKAHNMGTLTQIGVERRRNLAIISDFGLQQIAEQNGSGNSARFDMEFESVGEEDPEMTAPRLEEGLRIERGNQPSSPSKSRRRKAAE
jgi:hypothetical protein